MLKIFKLHYKLMFTNVTNVVHFIWFEQFYKPYHFS